MPQTITLIVPEHGKTQRLDVFCSTVIPNMTRSKLKKGLQSVLLNGAPAKLSSSVCAGDRISIIWKNPEPESLIPEPLPLTVLFENEDVIVVNKQAGMVTHPAAGNWSGTLVHALAHYRLYTSPVHDEFAKRLEAKQGQANFEELLRMGIVHRLDKETSGVLITARNTVAEDYLKKAFKLRKTEKYYLALLNGVPAHQSGVIETSVFRDPRVRIRFAASADLSKGKYARSRYKVLHIYGRYSFVMFKIDTGRTHQIRLHARFLGCPVIGDMLYGNDKAAWKQYGLQLHAYRLRLRLPCMREPSVFTAPLPERFRTVLARLRNSGGR